MSVWFVSRQCYWPDGTKVVEVAAGGRDYANAGMLCAKYSGEGEEYRDPVEAVEVAIAICRSWRRDGEGRAKVAWGATGGFTMPFEPSTFKEARAWAKERRSKLERCPQCGYIMPGPRDRWRLQGWDDEEFCSDHCAERFESELHSEVQES
jgi:hypothetical protein